MSSKSTNQENQDSEFGFYAFLNKLLLIISGGSSDEIDECINSSLAEVCKIFRVEESFIVKINMGSKTWNYLYDSRIRTEENMRQQIPFGTLPWTEKRMLANREIKIANIHELPAEAKIDFDYYARVGLNALLAEPLIGRGKMVKGCIGLRAYKSFHTWTDDDARKLRILGNVIANALERHNAEQERDEKERYISLLNHFTQIALESDNFNDSLMKMSEKLSELMGADLCGFGLWDEDLGTVYPAGASGAFRDEILSLNYEYGEKTITEVVLKSGQPLVIENLAQSPYRDYKISQLVPVSSVLVLPLKSKLNKMGSVFLAYKNPHTFSKEEILRCKQATEQVTLALNKIQLLENSQRHIEDLKAIAKISSSMRNAQSLSEIPGMIMGMVIDLCEVDDVALVFYDASKKSRVLFQSGENWQGLSQAEFFNKYQFIENVIKHGKTIQIPPMNEITSGLADGHGKDYLIAFPLNAHHQPLGAFCVQSQIPYTGKKIELLSAISDLIANGAYRQSLVDNLQLHLETLRTTKMQLVQSEKLAAIGELVAGVAHELNNPLTTIALSSELLRQQSISEQERYDLGKIISESHRAANIVRSLLDFSRQHTPEKKPVNVNVLLKSTVELTSYELSKNNIKLVFQLDPKVPVTIADPYQIKQVFVNLINNAVQAFKGVNHPRVLKIISEVGTSRYYGQMNNPEDLIRIIFDDNGPGILPSILPRIFDPFFTTKIEGEGTGLGLSVCHGIVTEHGGHIWAESGSEGGTRMFVEIPIQHPTSDEHGEVITSKFTSSNTSRILVVEDESSVLEVIQRALMRNGYSVDGAENGIDGLKRLEVQHYDLIICDIRMPGMGGIEFFQEVEKKDQELARRIIFTSGDTVNAGSQNFIKLTGSTLLLKPFELDNLLQVVQEKLSNPKSEFCY